MGFKLPFEDEELQELPFKNPRQPVYNDKLTRCADTIPHSYSPQKPHISVEVESGFCEHQWYEEFKTDALDDTRFAEEDSKTTAPISLVTSISSEEDTGTGVAAISPVSSECFDFGFQRRMFSPVEDNYYLLLDRSPRKQVPLGPNHQATVPSWGRHMKNNKFARNDVSEIVDNNSEDIRMGTCIIPMPDSNFSANISGNVAAGRTDCSCLDRGSSRCVQQHVMEARKILRESLGHEKFVKLGFYNMGEHVAYKWSEEDEEIFHEVVYNNPVSLGKKFWKQLSVVFPSRSKRELVSYYFNVFILQRRAIQNRSSSLDIDSDDDEFYGNQQSYEVQAIEEDEDSAIESLADQEDNNNEDDNSDNSYGYNGAGYYSRAAIREDYGTNLSFRGHVTKSFDASRFGPVFQQTDKGFGIMEDINVQDDSCMSFEFQPNMVDAHNLIDTKANLHVSRTKTDLSKSLQQGKQGESSELLNNIYLLDTCGAKIWDTRYSTSSKKGIDLQPTCNIIEEIFGQDTR
ncbi:hypothetical protein F3Y22_tig00111220pilonHSYRG00091 [Hibiscus syriacus]|uniref:Myb-like domain-containing protein n=1 Tax=Hibiscus syriacus TaxID=106335 RepID=A0A6A2YUH3_HIBSY|nr:uncharacterized protein LOC120156425 [Hibiscus syriacus]KAE8683033.1 hypothetical protein F3Y22_tig00111220pilonHSYRG00091 [Hibiscus syriacus]